MSVIPALAAALRKGATRRKQSASGVVNVHGSQPKGTNATVPGVMERKHEFAAGNPLDTDSKRS